MNASEDFKKENWRLNPLLDVKDLFPPAVLFSVFDFDPRPKFRSSLMTMPEKLWEGASVPEGIDPVIMKQARLMAVWDLVFREIPGDRVSLLYQTRVEGLTGGGENEKPRARFRVQVVSVGSEEPASQRWLVTKATRHRERPVCWCVPVDVGKGKSTDITLTVQNMTDLESV